LCTIWAEAEKHCAACDQDLRAFGEETSERYEYIPAQVIVIEDVLPDHWRRLSVRLVQDKAWPWRRWWPVCLPVHGEDGGQAFAAD